MGNDEQERAAKRMLRYALKTGDKYRAALKKDKPDDSGRCAGCVK